MQRKATIKEKLLYFEQPMFSISPFAFLQRSVHCGFQGETFLSTSTFFARALLTHTSKLQNDVNKVFAKNDTFLLSYDSEI